MELLDFPLEVKQLTEAGTFEGLASTYGPPADSYGDIVEPGAFTKTIRDNGGEVVVLWQHDTATPIGKGKLEDTERGLIIKGKLELGLSMAREAHTALKAKLVKGLSIGFQPIGKRVEDGLRYLSEIKLWEISLVTFGANPRALVGAVKSQVSTIRDFERHLRDIGFSRSEATRLASHGWKGLKSVDEDQIVLDEFSAWLTAQRH